MERLERFLFEPRPTGTVALLRVAYGVTVVVWALSVVPDLGAFYSSDGLMNPGAGTVWSPLDVVDSRPAVVAVWLVLLGAGVATTIGWHVRLATVLAFAGLYALQQRAPFTLNAGDLVLRHVGFALVFAPTPAAKGDFPPRIQWSMRLLQLQLTLGYAISVWVKLRGDTWQDGTAAGYAAQLDDLKRFGAPELLVTSLSASTVATYLVLAIEVAVPVLLWIPRTRYAGIALGFALHLVFELTFDLGFFGWAMALLYLAFVPPEDAARLMTRVRRRVAVS